MVPKAIGEGINIIYIETLDAGMEIILTAKADTGSIFDGWTGARCSSTGGCGNHVLAQERYHQRQLDPNGVRRLIPVHLEGLYAVRRCNAITIQAESSLTNFD